MSIIISALMSSVLFSCTPPQVKKTIAHTQQEHAQVITQKVEQIKKSYQKLIDSDYSKNAQQKYFDDFPNSFDSFISLFGYFDKKEFPEFNPAPLYDYYFSYIEAFFKLSSIDQEIYLKKMINICIDGFWQSNGVNLFRYVMKRKINESFKVFYSILKTYDKKKIKSFWSFYFAGPFPDYLEKLKKQTLKELNTLDKDMVAIVKEAYAKEREYWEKSPENWRNEN